MRRYERPHINEVWCGDSSVGPKFIDTDGKKLINYLRNNRIRLRYFTILTIKFYY